MTMFQILTLAVFEYLTMSELCFFFLLFYIAQLLFHDNVLLL